MLGPCGRLVAVGVSGSYVEVSDPIGKSPFDLTLIIRDHRESLRARAQGHGRLGVKLDIDGYLIFLRHRYLHFLLVLGNVG